MIDRITRGLGIGAATLDDPGYGSGGSRGSDLPTAGWTTLGSLPLVQSLGLERHATYRGIFLTNPWVWAAVQMIARSVARLPIQTFSLDQQGRKQRIRGDVLSPGRPSGGQVLDRLLAAPNGRISSFAQMHATMVDRLVYGNSLWEIERDDFGAVSAIPRVRWRAVRRVIEGADAMPEAYVVRSDQRLASAGGEVRFLAPDDVIHFGLGGDTEFPMGVSPLEACRHTIALYEAIMRHVVAYFANSARMSGNLKIDSVKLTRERAKEIRDMITELYTSPENAGKILVSSGEWQSMSDSPDHSQIIELIHESRNEIATTYAIPPPMLGILERAIKSNVKELREQYVRDSIGPWANEIENELQAQLLPVMPSWNGLFVEFQLAEQLRPDLEARALVYQRLQQVFSIDEIRSWENMPPLDISGVSDVPWVQSGALPITVAGGGGKPRLPLGQPTDEPAGPADAGDPLDDAAGPLDVIREIASALREARQADPELMGMLAMVADRLDVDQRLARSIAEHDRAFIESISELTDAIAAQAQIDPELLARLEAIASRPLEAHLHIPTAPRPRKAKAVRGNDGTLEVTYENEEEEWLANSQNGTKAQSSS